MSSARYERLSNTQDEQVAGVRRKSFTTTRHDDVDDDENEEIELNLDQHRLRYQESEHDSLNDELNEHHHISRRASNNNNNTVIHNIPRESNATHIPGSRFMQMAIGTLATILLYLTLSICLTFYQKALIKELGFPLAIVIYHLVIKFMLASLVRAASKWRQGKARVQLDWRIAVRKMAPTGIASGIDIGFSNWGLELVPISLYTMTKSSTIVFILFFAILLGLEKKSFLLALIVSLIALGLFMFTYKSTQFDPLGFVFILVASLSSGVRWTFAQFLMQKSKLGLHNPIDMIFHMQPWMIASLLPFLVVCEGQKLYDVLRLLPTTPLDSIKSVLLKISFAAILAFFMEISEFLVLSKTSSLTLSIAGIFKDICQLALAIELNNEQLSPINVLGLVVCLAGICCHLLHKYSNLTKMEELNAYEGETQHMETNMINANGSIPILMQKKHSAQTIPLLDETDTDDSANEGNEQSASEVIFDVLKRRDMQR